MISASLRPRRLRANGAGGSAAERLYSPPVDDRTGRTPSGHGDSTRVQSRPRADQGQIGSCTANAIAAAIEFELMKEKAKVFTPSRLFIYYNERALEGSIREDSGAQIRDGIKSVNKLGGPPEALWKYSDKNPGPFQKKPPKNVYAEAEEHQVTSYQRVPRVLGQFKGCLASGYPFVFGFTVYTAFEDEAVAKSGELDMPGPKEEVLGGHAVLAVGYDDSRQRFIVRNSWGPSWGKKGYFTMPYAYLLDQNLSDDFWTVRTVEM